MKSKDYLLPKPRMRSVYYKINYGNFNKDLLTRVTTGTNLGRHGQETLRCPTYYQGMKAIGFGHEDENSSEIDPGDFM